MDIQKIYLNKNSKLVGTSWDVLSHMMDKLKLCGIILRDYDDGLSFEVKFDFKKINLNSQAIKNNITRVIFAQSQQIYKTFIPEIIIIKNNEFSEIKKLDSLFPVKDFLIHIFDIVNIKYYKEENDKNKENIDKIIKNFEEPCLFKECFEYLKMYIDIIDKNNKNKEDITSDIDETFNKFLKYYNKLNETDINLSSKENFFKRLKESIQIVEPSKNIIKKKKLNETFKSILNTIKQTLDNFIFSNETLNKNFLVHNIKLEKTIFSEIFNFENEVLEIDEELNFLKCNYIYYAKKIQKSFNRNNGFIELSNQINILLEFL